MSWARALLGKTTAPCKLSVIHIALRPRSVQRTATEGTVNAYWLTGTETCIKIISSYVNDEVVADNDVQSSEGLLRKCCYPLSAVGALRPDSNPFAPTGPRCPAAVGSSSAVIERAPAARRAVPQRANRGSPLAL